MYELGWTTSVANTLGDIYGNLKSSIRQAKNSMVHPVEIQSFSVAAAVLTLE